jgi:hypothetical protein
VESVFKRFSPALLISDAVSLHVPGWDEENRKRSDAKT